MNQTPPISPVVKLKLKEIDNKKLVQDNALNSASSKLQSLLNAELTKDKGPDQVNKDGSIPITLLSSSVDDDSLSDRLSELISQLIPLHKSGLVTLSSDSISQVISLLNLTVTFLQNQQNLLNLLNLNYGINKEQFAVEKELLLKELEVMRLIHDRQRSDIRKIRRANSEPQLTKMKRRKLRAGKTPIKEKEKLEEEVIESDRTISDVEDNLDTKMSLSSQNKLQREDDYAKLISEISKNQKLFLHNKFGYYYNTLNDEKNSRRKKNSEKK